MFLNRCETRRRLAQFMLYDLIVKLDKNIDKVIQITRS